MEAVVGPELPNNHGSTIPSIHRNRPSQTHSSLPSFIATGHHKRIPPCRHSSQQAITNAFPLRHSS